MADGGDAGRLHVRLISLITVFFGAIIGTLGIRGHRQDWVQLAFGTVYANFALVSVASLAMIYGLVTNEPDSAGSLAETPSIRSTP